VRYDGSRDFQIERVDMTATKYTVWFFAVFAFLGRIDCYAQTVAGTIVPCGNEIAWWGPESGTGLIDGIPAGDDFVAVASGYWYAVALRSDGSIAYWGLRHFDRPESRLVPAGNDFVAIAAGQYDVIALRSDGSIASSAQFDPPPESGPFQAVAAGARQWAAIHSDGSLRRWGSSEALGGAVSEVPSGNDFVQISGSWEHFVALRSDGSIESFGLILGPTGTWGPATSPVGNDFIAVSAGRGQDVALRADGTLVTWGIDGHLLQVPTGNDFVAASNVDDGGTALRSDGSVATWGKWTGYSPAGNDFVALGTGVGHASFPFAIRRAPLPPVADAGPNQVLHCDGPSGVPVTLHGSDSNDPQGDDLEYEWTVAAGSGVVLSNDNQAMASGTFPVGVHEVTLTVYDLDDAGHRKGGVGVDSVTITVVDNDPPVALVTTDLAALLPANNTMRTVMVSVVASDQCTAPDDLLVYCTVSSNQPDNTSGNSNFVGDIDGQDGYSAPVPITLDNLGDGLYVGFVQLRAERVAADQSGRVYSINLDVLDAALNYQRASTTVVVPHSQRPQ
jgi:hypothetical protein